jgi:pyrroloquinoline quinone biosynthesis protein B
MLLNCSPDVAAQIESFAPRQPAQTRGTPIDGMMFTDANIDHLGGLAVLRQAGPHAFEIYSSSIVRSIAQHQPAFAPFVSAPHSWNAVSLNEPFRWNGLSIRGFSVPGTTPGYDGRRTVDGAVVAYEVWENERDTVLFAPVFSAVNDRLEQAMLRANVAFLDGSFFSDDEMAVEHLSEKTARHLGHLPVGGRGGTLEHLRGKRGPLRTIFTHLNNSNPMLDPHSDAAARIREAGAEIAYDGLEIST